MAKYALIDRVERRDGSWAELPSELNEILEREATACQRLSKFWLVDGDPCASYLADAWAGYLRTVDAQQYVEEIWLEQAEESLGGKRD